MGASVNVNVWWAETWICGASFKGFTVIDMTLKVLHTCAAAVP
jgi:hypothetical protein